MRMRGHQMHWTPFVAYGMGAPKGLTHSEHMEWSKSVVHPLSTLEPFMDDDTKCAIDEINKMSAKERDEHRRRGVCQLLRVADDLLREREAWIRHLPESFVTLLAPVHEPLLMWLAQTLQWR